MWPSRDPCGQHGTPRHITKPQPPTLKVQRRLYQKSGAPGWQSQQPPTGYYSDVVMSAVNFRLFAQLFVQAQIKDEIVAPRHLWDESTGDQWIPRTRGQYRVSCFHLTTSSGRPKIFTSMITAILTIHIKVTVKQYNTTVHKISGIYRRLWVNLYRTAW